MKTFSSYTKRYQKSKKKKRKRPHPVSLKSARDILRRHYLKKYRRNIKKATRALRRDMATKSPPGKVLRSKSRRSYLFRKRSKTTGPNIYDIHGLDNQHKKFKNKKTYRKYRKYTKKQGKKYGRPVKYSPTLVDKINDLFKF